MANGDSVVSICNIALIALGTSTITSLSDNVKGAILCKLRYDDCRRAVLRSQPWNCNAGLAQLPADATPPPFGYENRFLLPIDCLRVNSLPDSDGENWEVEGGYLLTNADAPLNVKYGTDLKDPTRFDPLLVQVIAYYLALELSPSLAQNQSVTNTVASKLRDKLEMARLVSSQENKSKEYDVDVLLRARR